MILHVKNRRTDGETERWDRKGRGQQQLKAEFKEIIVTCTVISEATRLFPDTTAKLGVGGGGGLL